MKRTHRKTHLIVWILLAPVIISTLLLAVLHRPAEPVNEALPDVLLEEMR
jgi:hypothetical protein